MNRAVIFDVPEEQIPTFNQLLDTFQVNGIKIISGVYSADSGLDALPHFGYQCVCGWKKISAIAINRCPRCTGILSVIPEGIVIKEERIPSFVKNA